MYTRILVVFFLYVYAAGEDGVQSDTHLKKDIESHNFSNFSRVATQSTKQDNKRQGVVRKPYNSNMFKLLAPIREDDSNEFKVKGDLKPNGHADSELQVPMFFISINNYTKNPAVASHKNNSSELIQTDGTYDMQNYVRPPFIDNQHQMQYSPSYSNREQMDYRYNPRNDPCMANQYMQPNQYGQRSYSEYDSYQAQGPYNVRYDMPPDQQRGRNAILHQLQVALNNWRRMNYNRPFVNPCLPNPSHHSSSAGRQHIYPYPNSPKPPNIYSPPSQNIYPDAFPPSSIQGQVFPPPQTYRGDFPPQNLNTFQIYPPQTFFNSHPSHWTPFTGRKKAEIIPPPYTKNPTPPSVITPPPYVIITKIPTPPIWNTPPPYETKTKSHTPPPYSIRTKIYTPPTWKTPTPPPHICTPPGKKITPPHYTSPWPGSSYTPPTRKTPTPPPRIRTTPGKRITPPHYTSPWPGSRTKSYTPPTRKTPTPPPRIRTTPGKKITPPHYTPPTRKTPTPPPCIHTSPGKKITPPHYTPPTPRSRTKSHTG